MLYSLLLLLFVLDCALLMVVILLQDSKGQGLGGAFGGGMSTAMFGGRGAANFLSKATTYLGTSFLVLCVIMSLVRPPVADDRSIIMDSAQRLQQIIPETGLPLLPGATPAVPPSGGILPTPGTPDTSGGGETN